MVWEVKPWTEKKYSTPLKQNFEVLGKEIVKTGVGGFQVLENREKRN